MAGSLNCGERKERKKILKFVVGLKLNFKGKLKSLGGGGGGWGGGGKWGTPQGWGSPGERWQ